MFKTFLRRSRNFGGDERGVVLVLFAVLLIPMLLLVAIAIDYSQYFVMKKQLTSAADAAALNVGTSPSLTDEEATAKVNAYIAANYPAASSVGSVTSVTVSRPDKNITTVTATARMNTTFLRLANISTLDVGVSSTSATSFKYFDIYTAVDMSASLGIAADAKSRKDLQAVTPRNCLFACHTIEDGGVTQSNYDIAHKYGIRLREDVLNATFADFVKTIYTSNPDDTVQRRVDVIGFSGPPGSPASDLVFDLTGGPTLDQDTAANALKTFPSDHHVMTQFEVVLPEISRIIGRQGTGLTDTSPVKMLVLVTDGVRSDRGQVYPYVNPLDKDQYGNGMGMCQAIKDKGIIVAVINVQYLDSTGDGSFNYWLHRYANYDTGSSTVYDELPLAMQECASPGWYFQATDTDQIDGAMAKLLDQINKTSLRLIK